MYLDKLKYYFYLDMKIANNFHYNKMCKIIIKTFLIVLLIVS